MTNDTLPFSKMHGLGNDFMVIDATKTPFSLDSATIDALGNRKTGVGFDQLLVVESASTPDVDFNYRIFNADGSEVEHCGNGARCFAKFVIDNDLTDKKQFRVKVKKGVVDITYHSDDDIEIDMGVPTLTPADIPFAVNGQTLFNGDDYKKQYTLTLHGETVPVSVLSMGNPHAVFMVSKVRELEIANMGKMVQLSDYFPESVNVNFVEMIDENTLELRTYERGVGETNACGTGACASAFAVHQLGATKEEVIVKTRGGKLTIRITNGRIYMSGPARTVYTAALSYPLDYVSNPNDSCTRAM